MRFTPEEIAAARRTVHAAMPPTPQYAWPLLAERLGCKVWAKHENHTPAGAFKLRGGLTYFETLAREQPQVRHVISATRGNHGQSVGFAARRHGLEATIVVPHGNSVEKNAAMRALGVTLVEHGDEFQVANEHAQQLAARDGLHRVPSFHRELVRGVATAYVEFFEALADAAARGAVRADRARLGLRGRSGCACALRRRDAAGRRGVGACDRVPRFVSRRPSGRSAASPRCWPTAWPAARRCRRRWK